MSAASSPSYMSFISLMSLSAKLHQKLLSKTSANGNPQILVLLASSDLKSNQLSSTKLVKRIWLQHNLVFQVEYVEEEQCWLCCNRWVCYGLLVGTQLTLTSSIISFLDCSFFFNVIIAFLNDFQNSFHLIWFNFYIEFVSDIMILVLGNLIGRLALVKWMQFVQKPFRAELIV